jgi:hypothetical protein
MSIELHKFVDEDYIYYTPMPEYFVTQGSHFKKMQMSNLVVDTRTNQLIKCRYRLEDLLEPLVVKQEPPHSRTLEEKLERLDRLKESCSNQTD